MIDSHVHFYDPHRPQGVPFPKPEDKLIYRPMLPDNLCQAAGSLGLKGAVMLESSPWIEDNQWALDLAARDPLICAVVGNLDPEDERFIDLLDRFARDPLYRGIRFRTGRPFNFQHPLLARHLQRLAEMRCTLDLPMRTDVLPHLARLAEANPGLKIMIDHLAAVPIDGREPSLSWQKELAVFNSLPNVYCKVSRFTELAKTQPAPLAMEYYAPTFEVVWREFGPDRLVFGSNWPPCLNAGDYAATVTILRDYLAENHPAALSKIMGRNAAAFYGGPRFAAEQ